MCVELPLWFAFGWKKRWQGGGNKRKRRKSCGKVALIVFFFVLLQKLLPHWLWYSLSREEPRGRCTTLWKGVTDALFLDFETSTIELQTKTMLGWLPRGVVYTLRSVREAWVASTHTLRVYYILLRGCLLCLFFARAVEGLEIEQTEVKHPLFCM